MFTVELHFLIGSDQKCVHVHVVSHLGVLRVLSLVYD